VTPPVAMKQQNRLGPPEAHTIKKRKGTEPVPDAAGFRHLAWAIQGTWGGVGR